MRGGLSRILEYNTGHHGLAGLYNNLFPGREMKAEVGSLFSFGTGFHRLYGLLQPVGLNASNDDKGNREKRQYARESRGGVCPKPLPPALAAFGMAAAMFALGFYIQGRARSRTRSLIGAGLLLSAALLWLGMLLFGALWLPAVCWIWNW
jgi:hypothetical protein